MPEPQNKPPTHHVRVIAAAAERVKCALHHPAGYVAELHVPAAPQRLAPRAGAGHLPEAAGAVLGVAGAHDAGGWGRTGARVWREEVLVGASRVGRGVHIHKPVSVRLDGASEPAGPISSLPLARLLHAPPPCSRAHLRYQSSCPAPSAPRPPTGRPRRRRCQRGQSGRPPRRAAALATPGAARRACRRGWGGGGVGPGGCGIRWRAEIVARACWPGDP